MYYGKLYDLKTALNKTQTKISVKFQNWEILSIFRRQMTDIRCKSNAVCITQDLEH
jgi:hypothetical protein